ncbi:head-tail adaptor protein [Devosia sp. D6-9]|nr:head-tail adaptor protein [Devosia sp. D6-9]
MASKPSAGALRGRVHCQKRQPKADPWGGSEVTSGTFSTVDTIACEFLPLRGSETVIANRLQGVQPYILRVRQSAFTKTIDTNWRFVDARDGREFAIRAPATDPDQKRMWLEFLCELGAPA